MVCRRMRNGPRHPSFETLESRLLLSLSRFNVEFDGIPYTGITGAGIRPPDPIAAAGPANLMAMVNGKLSNKTADGQVELFDKTGAVLASARLVTNLIGPLAPVGFLAQLSPSSPFAAFDPWAFYDRYSDRFVATVEMVDPVARAANFQIAISVSSTPDDLDTNPLTDTDQDWYKYSIPATYDFTTNQVGCSTSTNCAWMDYPKITADADSLYITANYFFFDAPQPFAGVLVTRLDKIPMLSGTLGARVDVEANNVFSLQPVQSIGRAPSEPQLFVDALIDFSTSPRAGVGIRVWEMDQNDVLTAKQILPNTAFTAHVDGANQDLGASQLGTDAKLDTVSDRIMNAVWRDNAVWTTHTVEVNGDATVRWYEIDTTGGTYSLTQKDDIDPSSGAETFIPAITVDAVGNMGITYTESSATKHPEMRFAWRRSTDSLNTTRPGQVIQASPASYNPSGAGIVERWGDYGGIALDPTDDATFWAFHEIASASNEWSTHWGAFSVNADLPAIFRDGLWFFDLDGAGGAAEKFLVFGLSTDKGVAGDWDGSGYDEPWVVRNGGLWFFDLNSDGGAAEAAITFGLATDNVHLAGDWDGDGRDDAWLVRSGNLWFIDTGHNGGAAEAAVTFGFGSDIPAVGDWDGDGRDEPWIFRPSNGFWYFDLNHDGGAAEAFAGPFPTNFSGSDIPVPGDWNRDSLTEMAVYKQGQFLFDLDRQGQAAEDSLYFGVPGDVPLAGRWAFPGAAGGGASGPSALSAQDDAIVAIGPLPGNNTPMVENETGETTAWGDPPRVLSSEVATPESALPPMRPAVMADHDADGPEPAHVDQAILQLLDDNPPLAGIVA